MAKPSPAKHPSHLQPDAETPPEGIPAVPAPAIIDKPAAASMAEDTFLSSADLSRLLVAQEKLQVSAGAVREARLAATVDQLTVALQQARFQVEAERLQVKSHEATIGLMTRAKNYEAQQRELGLAYGAEGQRYEALKRELGAAYKIDDWSKVTYDDVTGRITRLPELPEPEPAPKG